MSDEKQIQPRFRVPRTVKLIAPLAFVSAGFLLYLSIGIKLISLWRWAAVVLATCPLMLFAVLLIGWRLAVLSGREITLRDGMAVNAIAQLVALLVPSRISELAKPVGLNLVGGLPLSKGLTILAIERIFDAVVLALLAFSALTVLGGAFRTSIQSTGYVLFGIASVGLASIAVAVIWPTFVKNLAGRLPGQWLRNQAENVVDTVSRLRNRRTGLLAIALTFLSWLAAYLIFLLFFRVLGAVDLTFGQILVVFVASTLGLIVSVAPGGMGTFEGAVAVSLVAFDVPLGMAITLALLLRLCLVIPVVAAASWFLVSGDLNLGIMLDRLRHWRITNEQRD